MHSRSLQSVRQPQGVRDMATVYMTSGQGCEFVFQHCKNEHEAVEICEGFGWEITDDNGFSWSLEIRED